MSIIYTNNGMRPCDALKAAVNGKLELARQSDACCAVSYVERIVGENIEKAIEDSTELLVEQSSTGHCLVRLSQPDGTIVSFEIVDHRTADGSLDVRLSCGTLESLLKDPESGKVRDTWIAERLRGASALEEVVVNVAGRPRTTQCLKAFILEFKAIPLCDLRWLLAY